MSFLRKCMLGIVGMLSVAAVGSTGCDTVDAAFDCQAVCSRYRDCYDANYDVTACRDRCRTASANNPSMRSNADRCEACIGNMSCISATFNCATTCGSIVP